MNIYEVETRLQLNVTFISVVSNQNMDPTNVELFIADPNGNETVVGYDPGPIVRSAVGIYYYLFVPDLPGTWVYKWQGQGAVMATSRDTNFFVRASALIS